VNCCCIAFPASLLNFIVAVCTLQSKESLSAFLKGLVATGKPLASQFVRRTRHLGILR